MKITAVKPYAVKGGFRYWVFVKIETDEGVFGWGDASDWDAPLAIAQAVSYLEPYLLGEDPMAIEKIWWQNTQVYKRMWGGIAWKAMSGIDTALYDIAGKALGVPVYQLLGGKIRDRLKLYWTHCGSAQFAHHQHLASPQIRSVSDLRHFLQRVKGSGFAAVKTNIMALEGTALYKKARQPICTGEIDSDALDAADAIVGTMRDVLGREVDIALDTAFDYKMGGARQLARALERYRMMWLETETFDPDAQLALARSTTTPIVHGESLYDFQGYVPYLQRKCQDTVMIDLAWNGLTMGKKLADLALCYDTTVSPHNCHSPLTTFVAAHFCAAVKNFRILEIDYDDVPWRDEIITHKFAVDGGCLAVPDRPGLGTALVEEALEKYRVRGGAI